MPTARILPEQTPPLPSETSFLQTLPRTLGTGEMTCIYVMIIFFITNAATAATGGLAGITYWLLGLAFFLPCVLVTAQLGRMYPYEGGLYNWTYRALGPFWSVLVALCFWFPGILATTSAADSFVSYLQGLNGHWLIEPWQQGVVVMALLLFAALFACLPTRMVHRVVTLATGMIFVSITLIGLSATVWLLSGKSSATDFGHWGEWSVNPGNYGIFGLITLAYLGVNVPLNMGGEVNGRRAATRHLLWGSLLVVIGYLVSTVSLLIVRGPAVLNASVLPFELVSTVDVVFGKFAGNVTAIGILLLFAMIPVVYFNAFSRLILCLAVDKRIPTDLANRLTKLNRRGVPVRILLLQGLVAETFTALAFFACPYLLQVGKPSDLAVIFYNVSLSTLTLLWAFATVFLFLVFIKLYFRDQQAFQRERQLTRALLWACVVVGPLACLLAIVDTLFNSWIPQLLPNAQWTASVGISTAILIVVGVLVTLFSSEAARSAELMRDLYDAAESLDFDELKRTVESGMKRQN